MLEQLIKFWVKKYKLGTQVYSNIQPRLVFVLKNHSRLYSSTSTEVGCTYSNHWII